MSEPTEGGDAGAAPGADPAAAAVWVGLSLVALVGTAGLAFALLRTPPSPPPPEVAADPLLAAGRLTYLDRCVSCHGPTGRGDGPIAKGLAGPPVGNLTDATWKHGDRPEQVLAVVAAGVPGTAMPGWGRTLGPDGVRAVTAYVFHLNGRAVPPALRAP